MTEEQLNPLPENKRIHLASVFDKLIEVNIKLTIAVKILIGTNLIVCVVQMSSLLLRK